MSNVTSKTPKLVIFGEEFEKFGGLRILSMAETMHDKDPISYWDHYLDSCHRYLEEDQVLAGYTKDEDLYPLIAACYELRMEYGHGVWVGAALLDYLRGVRGIADAEGVRDYLVADAEAAFAPLRDTEELRTNQRVLAHFEDELKRAQRAVEVMRGRVSEVNDRIAMRQAA